MIVGPVTWDIFPDGRRAAGGTVSFAARTAAAFGVRAHVLTVAGPGADLSALDGHEMHVLEAAETLTFEHTFSGGVRTLRVISAPDLRLTPADAPAAWPAPQVLLMAPLLASDIDAAGFAALPVDECGVTAQGFLRRPDQDGVLVTTHGPTAPLHEAATERATIFLSSDEVAQWPDDAIASLARKARRLVITRGDHGAEIWDRDGRRPVPPSVATAVDTTGAGDVFATAFILALGQGEATAARLASAYAAAKVEVVGAAPLPDRSTIERRLSNG